MNNLLLISLIQNITVFLGLLVFCLFLFHYYYLGQGVPFKTKLKKSLIFLAILYVIGIVNGLIAQFSGVNYLNELYELIMGIFK